MANKTITQLTNYTLALSSDVLPIVDLNNNITKKITLANLQSSLNTLVASVGYAATIANSGNSVGLTIIQNDTTNNPNGISITNSTTSHAISVTQTGITSSSTSVGGAILLENTANTGSGLVIYSNAGASNGRLLTVRADNVLFDQDVVHIDNDGLADGLSVTGTSASSNAISASNTGIDHTINSAYTGSTTDKGAGNFTSTNTTGSTLQVTGSEIGKGTIKVTHNGTGTDGNSAALSLSLSGTNTACQGIFIDTSSSATGDLLVLRTNGTNMLDLSSTGILTINGDTTPRTDGGASLGSTSLEWANTYLVSGGSINWANGNATITHSTGILTYSVRNNFTATTVPITTGTTATSANFTVFGATNTGTTSTSQYLFGGASTVEVRTGIRGLAATLGANNSYGAFVVGDNLVTENGSGTHGLIANQVIKSLTITNAGGATTNTASLYIENAPTGITPTGANYALWIDDGIARLDGSLVMNSGVQLAYRAASSTDAIATTDSVLNYTSGTFTATLPTAVGVTGQQYIIKNSGTGVITVATTSSQTMDGQTSLILTSQYDSLTVVSNGANWIVV